MSNVVIRKYDPSDLEQCRALWVELTQRHRELYHDPTIGGDNPGLYFDKHLGRVGPEHIWVAEHDGEVVGLVGLIMGDREAEVEPIVVATTHRGKEIGRALLNHALEEARKLGVRYLSVRPVARNVEAISFCYDFGFRTLGGIEMFMELEAQAPGTWKPGPKLFGHSFQY
jgi:GNAT superfamily N-acetyltransferase